MCPQRSNHLTYCIQWYFQRVAQPNLLKTLQNLTYLWATSNSGDPKKRCADNDLATRWPGPFYLALTPILLLHPLFLSIQATKALTDRLSKVVHPSQNISHIHRTKIAAIKGGLHIRGDQKIFILS